MLSKPCLGANKNTGNKSMKTISTALFLVISSTAVSAGQTYDCSGTATGQSSAMIVPLAENHLVMLLPSKQTGFYMAVDGHPFEGLSGNCNGALEVINGAAIGQGLCVYENAVGDSMAVRWTGETITAEGALQGNWLIIGATGGLAGMTGGGDFTNLTNPETGAESISFTGAVTTK